MIISIPESLSVSSTSGTNSGKGSCIAACMASCETGYGSGCASCMSVSCQVACQWSCQYSCEASCQTTCETSCQTTCEGTCQTECESSCQTGCQTSCQTSCQTGCQGCEGIACQICQGCQTVCEASVQSSATTWTWKGNPVTISANGSDTQVRGLWSGFVNGQEVLCAACSGHLWELSLTDGVWSKTDCGAMDTSKDVHMFGFDRKLYLLNGTQYLVWDGTTLSSVTGYRPMVAVSVPPAGGGTALERVNRLTGARRCRFSPSGSTAVFYLPEKDILSVDYVKNVATGEEVTNYTADLTLGKLTFTSSPAEGINSLEVGWTAKTNASDEVTKMRFAELYNGSQDSRVFLYGDGSNKIIYSGLDYDGAPRADYFPDLNEAAIGDGNTPVTALIRHYNRLMVFKSDSAYSVCYGAITLETGAVTAGFYVTPVNRSVGCCAPGQAVLVGNRPRTLDGRSVVEWRGTTTAGNIGQDERNAEVISQRVDSTIRSFDLLSARCFYDKLSHEYYVIGTNGTALIHNVEADAWYVYTNFPALCLIRYKDELYYGTADGRLRHFSDGYRTDIGNPIDAVWESGSMHFSEDFRRKYSAMVWVGVKPEDGSLLSVTARTDRKADFAEYSFSGRATGEVPETARVRLKAKKFTYYKLILRSSAPNATATVVSADIRVRGTGYVR